MLFQQANMLQLSSPANHDGQHLLRKHLQVGLEFLIPTLRGIFIKKSLSKMIFPWNSLEFYKQNVICLEYCTHLKI